MKAKFQNKILDEQYRPHIDYYFNTQLKRFRFHVSTFRSNMPCVCGVTFNINKPNVL